MTETAWRPDIDPDDVIAVLVDQHEQLRAAFTEIMAVEPEQRQEPFDRLRELLATHESVEAEVLRPTTRSLGGAEVSARIAQEEAHANELLAELERLGVTHPRFEVELARFYQAMVAHAQSEESQEFPRILHEVPAEARLEMGRRLRDPFPGGPGSGT